MKPDSRKKNMARGIIFTLLCIVLFLGVYNFMWIRSYYYNLKTNHFSAGDSVYANDLFLSDTSHSTIMLNKIAKSGSGFNIILTDVAISNDSLRKYKSAN